ncbi:MAG: DNA repair protein RecO [Rhodospirillaceae bacterium]|nr:DNA repair protein RecO [Rhodospirillaceae bacterium]|tara:strand:- start:356 stop:1075 length:720 start_codon:yes stop_codon:yes gene_type:complete
MDWSDRGIVLSARRHGESAAIVNLLTRDYGRHAGLVRGGAGRRLKGALQPGNVVAAHWRGRLAEHLGSYTVELEQSAPSSFLEDANRLACLASACAVSEQALPERHPYASLYDGFSALLEALAGDAEHWDAVYVRWELGVLDVLGFGLDLTACAVTGVNDDLVYVSPRTGRAVSASAGEPYRERLLTLPKFLIGGDIRGKADIRAGLALTGHFLERHLFAGDRSGPPPARERFVARLSR